MIPLAFLHRTIYEMDIREHFYIVELRSKPAGHFSYRRIVNMMQACFADRPSIPREVRPVCPNGGHRRSLVVAPHPKRKVGIK